MKIYIASHCRWAALHIAHVLESAGHEINSRWIDHPFHPMEDHPIRERRGIAARDAGDVMEAEALVLVAGPDKYPGGKFVEAGIALGLGKHVVVLGHSENMLMWHPSIQAVEDTDSLVILLDSLPKNGQHNREMALDTKL